jgi:hypothetical protein
MKARVTRIFQFLRAFNDQEHPAPRHIQQQPWCLDLTDLPWHSSILHVRVRASRPPSNVSEKPEQDPIDDDVILAVRRPRTTEAPPPPASLADWIEDAWEDPFASVEPLSPEDAPATLVREHNAWCSLRNTWAQRERPARQALRLFEEFYELYALMEREGERHELILGDGILSWRHDDGKIEHPIVLQRLQLEFDPDAPEFRLRESAHPPEVYSSLFSSLTGTDGRSLARIRDRFSEEPCHPLGGTETTDFLSFVAVQLSPRGRVVSQPPEEPPEDPVVYRRPIVFQRTRTLGFGTALEAILENIETKDEAELCTALARVVGVEPPLPPIEKDVDPTDLYEHILLSKPANLEQIRIAERLEKYGSVLVQGPPGTGKTHTIANLIGHLLAQGKTVLVTADTTKALRVVRDHVEEKLRALCVSVLDNDLESRKQLEEAVNVIAEEISRSDIEGLAKKTDAMERVRAEKLAAFRKAKVDLSAARADEYRTIEIDGEALSPAEAAKRVLKDTSEHGWVPAGTDAAELPLSADRLIHLYRTNATTTVQDERDLSAGKLPDVRDLPSAEVVASWIARSEKGKAARSNEALWSRPLTLSDLEQLEALFPRLSRAEREAHRGEPWPIAVLFAGFKGGAHREPWDRLLEQIDSTDAFASSAQENLVHHAPYVETLGEERRLLAINTEIEEHLQRKGRITSFDLLMRPRWREYLDQATVGGKRPEITQHFEALSRLLRLRDARRELATRWDRLIAKAGGPEATKLHAEIEVGTKQLAGTIRALLAWKEEHLEPLRKELEALGFHLDVVLEKMPPGAGPHGELERLLDAIGSRIVPELSTKIAELRGRAAEEEMKRASQHLEELSRDKSASPLLILLARELAARDHEGYTRAFERLVELHRLLHEVTERMKLLEALGAAAPGWANAIRTRAGVHGEPNLPGDPVQGWRWRRLVDELDRRAKKSLLELQATEERAASELRYATADLIEARAWLAQRRRTTLAQQQALTGWLDTQRAIGKGTGKKVPELKMEARRLISDCQTAVPVWIMPLSRAVESFDARRVRFDVVIVDEASQCNLFALVALYLGKQVVVVGDHEQVSPSAVGESVDASTHLIAQHLRDIPNAHLYDGRLSVYDLARQAFGGLLALREHFRSVPHIIEFSNQLSYHGRIQPLRDGSVAELLPTTIALRVTDGAAIDKVNRPEAEMVAALLIAALEEEAYAGSTFGVVSLVGEEQAYEIESLLRRYLLPREFERRRIVCGNAAHFQGDERDVMFLTLVDAAERGVLPLRDQQSFKQRFNVAASRARNQMWVVHSLDPNADLKTEDLRRRLILHADSSDAAPAELPNRARGHASELERQIFDRLTREGYDARADGYVANCRIDIIVRGEGRRRIALMCDGDRDKTKETLEEDIAKESVLERMGWSFVRIRASEFYRDPDRTMRSVVSALGSREIRPGSGPRPSEDGGASYAGGNGDAGGLELKDKVIARALELRQTGFGGLVVQAKTMPPARRFEKRKKRSEASA